MTTRADISRARRRRKRMRRKAFSRFLAGLVCVLVLTVLVFLAADESDVARPRPQLGPVTIIEKEQP